MLGKDPRAKKIALVAHCLLNQNARVNGIASTPAMLVEVVELLNRYDYGILQLPCPETIYAGTRRWWHVKEQFNNIGFINVSKQLLAPIVDQIKEYQEGGFKVILIGSDGSPSCGVRCTRSNTKWGGRPELPEDEFSLIPEKGVFIELLLEMIEKNNLGKVPYTAVGPEEDDAEKIVNELEVFLKENQ
ncbi:MAG TPA: hypothetical protein GXZ24_02660 [Firmicutes bacterium]|jgi:predicted secreted protein|nr:hypothetical protein [Bacillota bacterium]